jgi:hypothetical protein
MTTAANEFIIGQYRIGNFGEMKDKVSVKGLLGK